MKPEALALPLNVDGRGARVAVLVYNDAQNDARVLKEAASLVEAGAHVRIFAVSNLRQERPAGRVNIHGLEAQRVREFLWADLLPAPVASYLKSTLGKAWTDSETAKQAQVRPGASPAQSAQPGPARPTTSIVGAVKKRAMKVALECARRSYGPARLTGWWARLVREVRQFNPDIIHANDANTLLPAVLIASGRGTPIIYDSHELWLHRNVRQDRILAPYIEAGIERLGVKRAAGVVTVSESIATWLQDRYALATRPTLVRNIPQPATVEDGGRLRELAGLTGDDVVLAYSGRITTSRGIEEALAALPLLDDTHLVLLGYGEDGYIASLRRIATDNGVADRFHIVGPLPSHEVSAALSDADMAIVHVKPKVLSYRFALPNKLFEAIHAGLPVVASDLPDIAQIVTTWGVGEVFNGESPTDLAAAVERVTSDRDRYRGAARAAARELTWEKEADKLVEVYSRALRRVAQP